ncbi:MAG: 2-polyprenyl-6-methoxyphenol hydroxylase [Tardiphaga sp.]|jgi:2-polyprenyl-6-methoxyphenol hydroxylase-like FAD-dependent oxidoreductase|nr:2-polyprenyl-6-methoxyphenol hydroxylase [Tardiphaga sp.]
MPVPRQRKAVIAGGSVGGLLIGNMLLRQGWAVEIFERATSGLESRGAGIAGHAELTAILKALGVSNDRPPGIDVSGRIAFDRHGNQLANFDYPQYLTSWSSVFNLLLAAFPPANYHLGVELLDISEAADGAVAVLSNGERVAADLIVGADGVRSRVRGLTAPDIVPSYGGYVAWRGIIDETGLSAEFMATTFDRFSFCFPPGGQFIGYPLLGQDGSTNRGGRRYNFLWYTHTPADDLEGLMTDESGERHESIPPPLIRKASIDALRQAGARDLPAQFAEVVQRADRHLLQPIYDVESRHIAFGPVALLGDAAFVARPHVGIGVLKAAQDAASLARNLAECAEVPEALQHYERERLQPNIDAVEFGRYLGNFIERGLAGPTSDPELNLSYEFIIRESARLPRVKPPLRRASPKQRMLQ